MGMNHGTVQARSRRAAMATAVAVAATTFAIAGLLSACAPKQQQADASSGEGADAAIAVAWSADMACSSCHAHEAQTESDTACLASKHEADSCESCHGTAEGLAGAHANASADASMPTKLSKEHAVSEEACLACHGSWDELAAKSVDVTVLTDADGTTVNPHAMDRTGDHAAITCTSCHSVHEAETDQKELCLSCHHEDVFECRTCHE